MQGPQNPATSTTVRKATVISRVRQTAPAAAPDQLPETANPPEQDNPLGGQETRASAKDHQRSLAVTGSAACLRGAPNRRPSGPSRVVVRGHERGHRGARGASVPLLQRSVHRHATTRAGICPRAQARRRIYQSLLLHAICHTLDKSGLGFFTKWKMRSLSPRTNT